jgi:hypothetical protein
VLAEERKVFEPLYLSSAAIFLLSNIHGTSHYHFSNHNAITKSLAALRAALFRYGLQAYLTTHLFKCFGFE